MPSAGIAQDSYQEGLTFKSSLMLLKLMKWICKWAAQHLPLQIPGGIVKSGVRGACAKVRGDEAVWGWSQ